MSVVQRFKEIKTAVGSGVSGQCQGSVIEAAAMLTLAEVLQGTTHSVDVNLGEGRIDVRLSGDPRDPVRAEVEQR